MEIGYNFYHNVYKHVLFWFGIYFCTDNCFIGKFSVVEFFSSVLPLAMFKYCSLSFLSVIAAMASSSLAGPADPEFPLHEVPAFDYVLIFLTL